VSPNTAIFIDNTTLPGISEANFMRDFACCGQTLPTLSELLQRYEEAHAQQAPQSSRAASSASVSKSGEEDLLVTVPQRDTCTQQTPQSTRTASSAAKLMLGEEHKPLGCPVIGCEKAYKNQNGLKYVPQKLVG
jgi:transcription factor SFP1